MNTRVDLVLNQKVNLKIIKEVKKLSKVNTSDNESIQILQNELDDRLLIIKFKSPNGKKEDLAYSILKSYSLHISYSEILISFQKKRNELYSKLDKVKKKEIIHLIREFNKSFDIKDWILMSNCLAEKIEIDYKSLRNDPKKITKSSKYIAERKKGLADLRTIHKTKDHKTRRFGKEIKCSCKFVIERYQQKSEEYFHSYGIYSFVLKLVNDTLKIVKITQIVEKNEGNLKIHGAFKEK